MKFLKQNHHRNQGINVEIGGDTTKLSKALESVNKSIKGTQSGLKDAFSGCAGKSTMFIMLYIVYYENNAESIEKSNDRE